MSKHGVHGAPGDPASRFKADVRNWLREHSVQMLDKLWEHTDNSDALISIAALKVLAPLAIPKPEPDSQPFERNEAGPRRIVTVDALRVLNATAKLLEARSVPDEPDAH